MNQVKVRKITLKFEDQLYQVDLPIQEGFTGSISLIFYWQNGFLMKSEVNKSSAVKLSGMDLSTVCAFQTDTEVL